MGFCGWGLCFGFRGHGLLVVITARGLWVLVKMFVQKLIITSFFEQNLCSREFFLNKKKSVPTVSNKNFNQKKVFLIKMSIQKEGGDNIECVG